MSVWVWCSDVVVLVSSQGQWQGQGSDSSGKGAKHTDRGWAIIKDTDHKNVVHGCQKCLLSATRELSCLLAF